MITTANVLNLFSQTIRYGTVHINGNRIAHVEDLGPERPAEPYILPGFVDAHVHIESSLLTPAQFARLAVVHGTVATVSDPHEIGNVLGISGVEYMIRDSKRVSFTFCFGAPPCVPATVFETAGAEITADDVEKLLAMPEIGYLAEVMNFPGVLNKDPDMMQKIALAKAVNKPIDGHAPGLRGADAQQYMDAGISTDHECFTLEEARDKAQRGMKILIREGSAARNFDALIPIIAEFPAQVMFCSDDKHPDTLVEGHINQLVIRAIALGYDRWAVLRAASQNPVLHYGLSVGLLRQNDSADFIVVNNLTDFGVMQTVIRGDVVAEAGQTRIADLRSDWVNKFDCLPIDEISVRVNLSSVSVQENSEHAQIRVIEALDGQLITNELHLVPTLNEAGEIIADPSRDVLKLVVVNRYRPAAPAVAFIKNFGLKHGAIASSVAHDSHNIIAVGCDDASLCHAINAVIEAGGGLSAFGSEELRVKSEEYTTFHYSSLFTLHSSLLKLPIAGLMTDADGYAVAAAYSTLDRFVKNDLGSTLAAPFMTLSFMALLVIPALKLSDKGLFDGQQFSFVPLGA
jgi:adenine deaminase